MPSRDSRSAPGAADSDEKLRAPRRVKRIAPPRLSPALTRVTLLLGVASVAGLLLTSDLSLGSLSPVSLWLLAGSVLVALVPVRIPALRIDVNSTHPFVLCLLAVAGPLVAAAADVAGVVITTLLGRRRRPLMSHLTFNLSAVVVSVIASWLAFRVAGGRTDAAFAQNAAALLAAGSAYYVVNVLLVSLALGTEAGRSPITTIRETCSWTSLPYLAGIPAAAVMLWLLGLSTVLALLFGAAASLSLGPLLRVQARLLGQSTQESGATDC